MIQFDVSLFNTAIIELNECCDKIILILNSSSIFTSLNIEEQLKTLLIQKNNLVQYLNANKNNIHEFFVKKKDEIIELGLRDQIAKIIIQLKLLNQTDHTAIVHQNNDVMFINEQPIDKIINNLKNLTNNLATVISIIMTKQKFLNIIFESTRTTLVGVTPLYNKQATNNKMDNKPVVTTEC
jgi:hypothetical protein